MFDDTTNDRHEFVQDLFIVIRVFALDLIQNVQKRMLLGGHLSHECGANVGYDRNNHSQALCLFHNYSQTLGAPDVDVHRPETVVPS